MPEQVKKVPHKHAEVIKAWADGAKVQFRKDAVSEWEDIPGREGPLWITDYQYRVKPEKVKKEFWVIVKRNKLTGEIYTTGSYSSRETAEYWIQEASKAHIQYIGVHKIEIVIEV